MKEKRKIWDEIALLVAILAISAMVWYICWVLSGSLAIIKLSEGFE